MSLKNITIIKTTVIKRATIPERPFVPSNISIDKTDITADKIL